MKRTNKITIAAMLLAIGIILPTIFHATGISGKIFLPMHIPVLIAGLILGGKFGLLIGALLPILNHFVTGMPAIPFLYTMIFELAVYGLVTGFLYKKIKMKLLPSLISGMLLGRVASAIGFFLLTYITTGKIGSFKMFLNGAFIVALPGIIIQLILIPIIVKQYEKSISTSWI